MGHVPSERIQAWFSLATTLDSADWEVRYYMRVSKNKGYPKMDGENNGKPYENGWFLGEHPALKGNPHISARDFF